MFEAAFHGLYSPLIVASGAIKEVPVRFSLRPLIIRVS
jgi:hypothetical protein